MKCPGFNQLIDLVEGKLTGDRAAELNRHLESGCRQCESDRQWYLRVQQLAASDDSVEPPAWVTKRALRLFESRRTQAGLARRLGELVASLVFDSFARPALVGTRSAEPSNRQMLYRAGDYSIDLLINPSGRSRADLMGQVLREGDFEFECVNGLSLELVRGGRTVSSAKTNSVGEFSISGLNQGDYDLKVETAEVSITIQNLPLSVS